MAVVAPVALEAYEDSSALYTGTLVDEAGDPVPAASLTSATLTLTDERTRRVINGWSATDILNTNGVTISAAGVISWPMTPADNPVLGDGVGEERHVAVMDFRWGSGKGKRHKVFVDVVKVRV